MHLPINLCLTKPSLWLTILGRKKIARGCLAATRPTLTSLTRSIILLREVEGKVPIAMEVTLTGEMATTTMEGTAMVITMAITMDIPMGTTDSTVPTLRARLTCQMSRATNARKLGTMLTNVQN